MLSASSRTAPRQIPSARLKNSNTNDGAGLRDLRLLLGMTLEEACRRYPEVDVPRLSRYERGIRCISEERRRGVEKMLLAEISVRAARMAKVIASADGGMTTD
jgi:hypothetical protein